MIKKAIISVYDKTGLDKFVLKLVENGVKIYSTGGTAKYISKLGIDVVSISDYTGSPEVLDGRVKSLHPKIHGGILARKNNQKDLEELKENNIEAFDMVVVNLYPFKNKVAEVLETGKNKSLIEDIDIGGPTLLRAAAKNCEFVLPVSSPEDYDQIIENFSKIDISFRRSLAAKTFAQIAQYDLAIARYFSIDEDLIGFKDKLAPIEGSVLKRVQGLRYGENPHQSASLYKDYSENDFPWEVIQGKELSYNNILDSLAALEIIIEVKNCFQDKKSCIVLKHSNPCGAAVKDTVIDAIKDAKAGDPVSSFGGIFAVAGDVGQAEAKEIIDGFVEVLLLESISDEARSILAKKKNIRVIICNFNEIQKRLNNFNTKTTFGMTLLQQADLSMEKIENQVSGEPASSQELEDAKLAWALCKHVKSNAVIAVKNLQAIGVGAGQMSRVDSAKLVVSRSSSFDFDLNGACAASDAFLPFADTLEILNDGGVSLLVQPGGSIKDKDVIEVAKQRGVKMFFTGNRHFKH